MVDRPAVGRAPLRVKQPFEGLGRRQCEGPKLADAVEKVAVWRFQSASEKIDLSDRPASLSRTSVNDKKTPENLARRTVTDFFNSIGRARSVMVCELV
jgi:hypothetical protein